MLDVRNFCAHRAESNSPVDEIPSAIAGPRRQALRRWTGRASVLLMLCGVAVMLRLGPCDAVSGTVPLGDSGWNAIIPPSLENLMYVAAIRTDHEDQDAVFIIKTAIFTEPPVNGVFPAIPITFEQVNEHAVSNIVIEEEHIENRTGTDWNDFHIQLIDGGSVGFDLDATANSGGLGPIGFSIAPFTQAKYGFFNDDGSSGKLTQVDFFGGVIPTEGQWNPGVGVPNTLGSFSAFSGGGQLWITTEPTGDSIFVLQGGPAMAPVPLPASVWSGLALLGAGAVVRLIRHKLS